MGKIKAALRNKTVAKNTQTILKKRKKKERKNKILRIHKDDLNKVHISNETTKNISTDIQKKKKKKKDNSLNISFSDDTKRLNISIKHPKENNKVMKISQAKVEFTENKTKRKKRNRKKSTNANATNPEVTETNSASVKTKKIQKLKKLTNLKQNKTKTKINKEIEQESIKLKQIKSNKILNINNHKIKLKLLEEMLVNKAQTKHKVSKPQIKQQPITLRDRMMAQLRASRFRFINETLYNNESVQSKQYFKEDPDAFKAYHDGYKQQIEQWPVNPLDIIISSIKKMPKDNIIADFGCGEARLAASVPHKVHSFDFISINDRVQACDMAHTPLLTNGVHVVVFCLSLMGTNLKDLIIEANRVLKNNGILKLAEVESRFEDVENFIKLLSSYGFKNTWKDLSHNLFYFMDFKKEKDLNMKRNNLPPIILKPCLYKKR